MSYETLVAKAIVKELTEEDAINYLDEGTVGNSFSRKRSGKVNGIFTSI